jgi:hypothetical protein
MTNWGPPSNDPSPAWMANDRGHKNERRMKVRLTRKLAPSLNGVNLSAIQIGEVVELPEREARMLIAEGWAESDD